MVHDISLELPTTRSMELLLIGFQHWYEMFRYLVSILFDLSNDDVGQCLLLLARIHFGLSDSPSVTIPFGYAT